MKVRVKNPEQELVHENANLEPSIDEPPTATTRGMRTRVPAQPKPGGESLKKNPRVKLSGRKLSFRSA